MFSGVVQELIQEAPSVEIQRLAIADGRGVGAIVDAVLTLPGLFVSILAFRGAWRKVDRGHAQRLDRQRGQQCDLVCRPHQLRGGGEHRGRGQIAAVAVHVIANVCTGGLLIADAMIGTPPGTPIHR